MFFYILRKNHNIRNICRNLMVEVLNSAFSSFWRNCMNYLLIFIRNVDLHDIDRFCAELQLLELMSVPRSIQSSLPVNRMESIHICTWCTCLRHFLIQIWQIRKHSGSCYHILKNCHPMSRWWVRRKFVRFWKKRKSLSMRADLWNNPHTI